MIIQATMTTGPRVLWDPGVFYWQMVARVVNLILNMPPGTVSFKPGRCRQLIADWLNENGMIAQELGEVKETQPSLF